MFEDKLDEIEKDFADKLSKQGEKLIKEIKTKGEVLREGSIKIFEFLILIYDDLFL